MNILIPDSWLKEFVKTDANPSQIMECLSLCGPSVERINTDSNDSIYDIEITTNRVDMASVIGIAREAAAILPRFNISATYTPPKQYTPKKILKNLPITIQDPQKLCDRLIAVVIDNVTIGPSPKYIKERLQKCGVRSLNNLIDITNYVMLEIGHPCHVFDYDRITSTKLLLRKAKNGESLITLDNKECKLTDEDVVIDDGTGEIIDLPGIMGTKNSVVTNETKRILFFIESNNPVVIRRTSLRLSLRTMAAAINEKHPDPQTAFDALLRGIELFETIGKGNCASEIIDLYPGKVVPKTITISPKFITDRLGVELSTTEIKSILSSLSFRVKEKNGELQVIPPHYRMFDISIAEDIVEEVSRIYGYHRLPSRIMTGSIPSPTKIPDLSIEKNIKRMLKFYGFTETYSYSFVSKELLLKSDLNPGSHLRLSNPLSRDIEYMRTSLVPSILDVAQKNQSFSSTLQLFELAKVYLPNPNELPSEESMLVIISTQDFFHLKGICENLFTELGIERYDEKESTLSYLHPNKSLRFIINSHELGSLGVLHPRFHSAFELEIPMTVAYFSVKQLVAYSLQTKKYIPIPKYPAAFEQLSLIVPKTMKLGEVIKSMKKEVNSISEIELLESLKNSITLKVTYQDPDKNLSSEEIARLRNTVLELLESKFEIRLKR